MDVVHAALICTGRKMTSGNHLKGKRMEKKTTRRRTTKDILLKKRAPKRIIKPDDLIPFGALPVDLACSGSRHGTYAKGHFYYIVGDSSSGKTFEIWTMFAEAAKKLSFDDYDFIFDDIEKGSLMDLVHFFGKKVTQRVRPPAVDSDGNPMYSEIIEDLYFNLADAIESGKPFIYVADSMDALSSKADQKKFQKRRSARRSGKEEKGEMSDGKAKVNSSNLRGIINGLKETGSILILIGQTRDALNTFNPFGPTKTRSGGRSLTFYATLEMWLSVAGREVKTVNGRKRRVGITSQIQIKKNRIHGNDRTVRVPILNAYGIDDTRACIRLLVDEKHWSRNKNGQISATEFETKLGEDDLVEYIENEDLVPNLHLIVTKVWNDVERKLLPDRKGRYE